MTTGNASHAKNNATHATVQMSNANDRPIIFTERIKKLIILPCQSYCPYIGTKIFTSQRPGNNSALPACTKLQIFPTINFTPPVYHQIGK